MCAGPKGEAVAKELQQMKEDGVMRDKCLRLCLGHLLRLTVNDLRLAMSVPIFRDTLPVLLKVAVATDSETERTYNVDSELVDLFSH